MSEPTLYGDQTIERILEQLAEGKSLALICKEDGMPSRRTVQRWLRGDDELASRMLEAREVGFHFRAEVAVAKAQNCSDPIKGRLAFDAERWYLGKLSNAFADKPIIGVSLNADDGTFDAIAGLLAETASTLASRSERTCPVVIDGEARPGDAAGRLADLAGDGGPGLGED